MSNATDHRIPHTLESKLVYLEIIFLSMHPFEAACTVKTDALYFVCCLNYFFLPLFMFI